MHREDYAIMLPTLLTWLNNPTSSVAVTRTLGICHCTSGIHKRHTGPITLLVPCLWTCSSNSRALKPFVVVLCKAFHFSALTEVAAKPAALPQQWCNEKVVLREERLDLPSQQGQDDQQEKFLMFKDDCLFPKIFIFKFLNLSALKGGNPCAISSMQSLFQL